MTIPVTKIAAEPGPEIEDAFVADKQRFWGSFTTFVMFGAGAVVLLLIVMAFFLT